MVFCFAPGYNSYWLRRSTVMLNSQLHLEHRMNKIKIKNKIKNWAMVQCLPVAANPSETRGLPCAFITHREDLRATRSTETLLLVGKRWQGLPRRQKENRKDGKKDWKKLNLLRCVIAPLSLKQLSLRFESFPDESNYRSISTAACQQTNPAFPNKTSKSRWFFTAFLCCSGLRVLQVRMYEN